MQMTSEDLIEVTEFTWPKGYDADSTHAGLKPDQDDMGWIYSEEPADAAGVYTTNQFQAAPTKLTKQTINLAHKLQAVVMNAGNANSCNGSQGETDAIMMQKMAADRLQIDPHMVGIASTGVIGEPLPMAKIKAGISQLKLTKNVGVTKAILTTDTHPKTITVKCLIGGKVVTTTGFCKGSGMIHPIWPLCWALSPPTLQLPEMIFSNSSVQLLMKPLTKSPLTATLPPMTWSL